MSCADLRSRDHESLFANGPRADSPVIIEKLYDAVPTYSPAIITHMRHSRASDQALAAMAVCLGLCPRVKTTDHELSARSKSYEAEVRAKWKDATGILRKRGHQQTAAGSSKTETLVEGQEAMMEQVTEFWIGIVPYMSVRTPMSPIPPASCSQRSRPR